MTTLAPPLPLRWLAPVDDAVIPFYRAAWRQTRNALGEIDLTLSVEIILNAIRQPVMAKITCRSTGYDWDLTLPKRSGVKKFHGFSTSILGALRSVEAKIADLT